MDIHRLPPDGDPVLLDGVVDLSNAVTAHDAPFRHPETRARLEGALRYGWDGEPFELHVGLHDGRVVASGTLDASAWDNLDLAWLNVAVAPDRRRAGLGSAMFAHLVKRAADLGRAKIGTDGWDGTPAEPFAVHHGLSRKSQSIQRRQHLHELDLATVRRLHAEAAEAASAYTLVRMEGRVPDDMLPALAEVVASINDAPLDDLDIEDEAFPPERIRSYEAAQEARRHRLRRVVALRRDDGSPVGHTVVAVEERRPHLGEQHDTTVARAHRGHRLGLLLKAEMVLWLLETEPQLETVDTWNAESNDHMIAVNEALGYRWLGRLLEFQP